MAPYSFLTARDGASFNNSTRKSRAINRNEMSTNMASKFVKKNLSGISKAVTPPVRTAVPPTTSRCTNGRFGKTKQQKSIGPMRDGLKSWRLRETPTLSAKRKLVFESATDENEPPTKYQTRSLKVKYNSPFTDCQARVMAMPHNQFKEIEDFAPKITLRPVAKEVKYENSIFYNFFIFDTKQMQQVNLRKSANYQ